MPYDATKDPKAGLQAADKSKFGTSSALVAPSDSADLARYAYLYCAAGGNVVFLPSQNADGTTVTITGLTAGMIIPFMARRVLATGTTATLYTIEG